MSVSTARSVAAGIATSSAALIPVPLVGGLAVLIQRDLGFGEAQLGTAIAIYFASAALTAAPGGRLSERLGSRAMAWTGLACVVAALLGIALIADSWFSLTIFLILAGIGQSVALLGVAVLVTRSVAAHRRGLAFGAAWGAAPLAALLAGLAVPAIGLTLGWRAAFVLAAAMGLLAAATVPTDVAPTATRSRSRDGDAPFRALILLAVGMALASAGGNASAVVIVASAVDQGVALADAGLILAMASAVGLIVRIGAGWLGDRLGRGSLVLLAALLGVGALGYAGLAVVEHPALIVLFASLAFGGGWGWPGLMLLAVSRSSPGAPGTAMGLVTVGGLAGAIVGPLAFGALADQVAFSASWLLLSALAILAVGIVLVGRQRIVRSRPQASMSP